MTDTNSPIQSNWTIQQLLETYPNIHAYFQNHYIGYEFPGKFNCLDCPMAKTETIEQAARSHGIEPEQLILELNAARENTIPETDLK